MKSYILIGMFAIASAFSPPSAGAQKYDTDMEFVPHEVLVLYEEDAPLFRGYQPNSMSLGKKKSLSEKSNIQDTAKKYISDKIPEGVTTVSTRVLSKEDLSRTFVLSEVKNDQYTPQQLMKILAGDENIDVIEPNFLIETFEDEGVYSNIYNNDANAGVSADIAWAAGVTGKDVIVAVIDTGVNLTHPDLLENIWQNAGENNCENGIDDDNNGFVDDCAGWDFFENNNHPYPGSFHGTHVAGTVAAVQNGVGAVGVAPEAKIMAIKVFGDQAAVTTADALFGGMQYAIEHNANILSMSLGTTKPQDCSENSIFGKILKAAQDDNITVIAATGNSGPNTSSSPANCPGVIGVGSTDKERNLSPFSSYQGDVVDIVAPGSDIMSTALGNGYQSSSGTSMATPHISGIVALILQKNPGTTPQQIQNILCETSDDIGANGKDEQFGCGFPNINNILQNIGADNGNAPMTTPENPEGNGGNGENTPTTNPFPNPDTPENPEGNGGNGGNTPITNPDTPEGNNNNDDDDDDDQGNKKNQAGLFPKFQITAPQCNLAPVDIRGWGEEQKKFALMITRGLGVQAQCTQEQCIFSSPKTTGFGVLLVASKDEKKVFSSLVFVKEDTAKRACEAQCFIDSFPNKENFQECSKKCTQKNNICPDVTDPGRNTDIPKLTIEKANKQEEIETRDLKTEIETNEAEEEDSQWACSADDTINAETLFTQEKSPIIQSSADTLWKPITLQKPKNAFALINNGPASVQGMTNKNTRVRIYYKAQNTITCIETKSDQYGFYSIHISEDILRDYVGRKMHFVPLQERGKYWDMLSEKSKKKVYTIDSILMQIRTDAIEGCREVCRSGTVESVRIFPEAFPRHLIGKNFEELQQDQAILSRGPRTYSYFVEKKDVRQDEAVLQRIAAKSILMEIIKRSILGDENSGGSGIGLRDISPRSLQKTFNKEGRTSPVTRNILQNIHDALVYTGDKKDNALRNLESMLIIQLAEEAQTMNFPEGFSAFELLQEIFPQKNVSVERWRYDFIKMLTLWTGSSVHNSCLLDTESNAIYHFVHQEFSTKLCQE